MRVYEAAKKFGVTSKEVLQVLRNLGQSVTTANSNVPQGAMEPLSRHFEQTTDTGEEKKAPEEGVSGSVGTEVASLESGLASLEGNVTKVRIGDEVEATEEMTEETAVPGADEGDQDAETASGGGSKRRARMRKILLEKGKIHLHTKIGKSQRPFDATRDAIRREIMMDKGRRFEETRRAREERERRRRQKEEEEARKRAEEERKRLEAEQAARKAQEEAVATKARETAEERLKEAVPAEPQAAPEGILEAPPEERLAEEAPVQAPPSEVTEERARRKKKGKREKRREDVLVVSEEEERKSRRRVVAKAEPVPEVAPPRPRRRISRPADRRQSKNAWKREKRERVLAQQEQSRREEELAARTVRVNEATTVGDVARDLGVPSADIIKKLLGMGMMVTIQQRLDPDTVRVLADDYGFEVQEISLMEDGLLFEEEEDRPEDRVARPPVATIMGHVDHGKTKLLDAIRDSDIVGGEAGGITQHIGAYKVRLPSGGEVVFLDTPGHEAFTAMRARGTVVTDIVVLVVAANEGVMPQTIEALNHAKAAGVPIVVAVNKMDLPEAMPDKVKEQLASYDLVPEEWGGKTMYVPVSALKREGIADLLEALLLEAEILELKANPKRKAVGTIIESRLDRGRGPVATVLVQEGTLEVGDAFVTGVYSGRVRALIDDHGEITDSVPPATPVEVLGLEGIPQAGDPFHVVASDREAKDLSIRLQQIQRERELRRAQHVTLDDLYTQISKGEVKDLNIIVRGDVHGSVEALKDALNKIVSEKVRVNVIHDGVGAILESDVMLASASNALIIGFNVRPNPKVAEVAERERVEIRCYRVIYQAIEDIRAAMLGLVEKEYREVVKARAEVREVFRIPKTGTIAGSYVLSGRIGRNDRARVLRDDVVVYEGTIGSLRRFKDDVREVASDFECGIGFDAFSSIQVGDVVECFELEEMEATL